MQLSWVTLVSQSAIYTYVSTLPQRCTIIILILIIIIIIVYLGQHREDRSLRSLLLGVLTILEQEHMMHVRILVLQLRAMLSDRIGQEKTPQLKLRRPRPAAVEQLDQARSAYETRVCVSST